MKHESHDEFRRAMLRAIQQQWETMKEAAYEVLDAADQALEAKSPDELDSMRGKISSLRAQLREQLEAAEQIHRTDKSEWKN